MRLIVFFDLPIETAKQRRNYRLFRRFLINDGYQMLQKSVYTRLTIDGKAVDAALKRLEAQRPPEGLVQALRVTEKQFAGMHIIAGDPYETGVVDSMERVIII